jgi:chromosome segregation ATPase
VTLAEDCALHFVVRTKQLTWSARVVQESEYQLARAQALEIQREKKKFEDQRHALRRCAVSHTAILSGAILNTSIVSDHAHEEKMRIRELEDEIINLNNHIHQYQLEIEAGNQELDSLDNELAALEQSKNLVNESWQFSLKQLDAARSDLKSVTTDLQASRANEREKDKLIRQYEKEVISLKQELQEAKDRESNLIAMHRSEIDHLQALSAATWESKEARLKEDFEARLLREVAAARAETDETKATYETQLKELSDLCVTLEQRFLKVTAPKEDVDSIGYFADTLSEIELRQRLEQLEREYAFLENQKDTLEHELKQAKKQIAESTKSGTSDSTA